MEVRNVVVRECSVDTRVFPLSSDLISLGANRLIQKPELKVSTT
jgi:hypothetical protein